MPEYRILCPLNDPIRLPKPATRLWRRDVCGEQLQISEHGMRFCHFCKHLISLNDMAVRAISNNAWAHVSCAMNREQIIERVAALAAQRPSLTVARVARELSISPDEAARILEVLVAEHEWQRVYIGSLPTIYRPPHKPPLTITRSVPGSERRYTRREIEQVLLQQLPYWLPSEYHPGQLADAEVGPLSMIVDIIISRLPA